MILLIISFIAGILTILAPCILPLLPVIVGGSITDGESKLKKPLVIIGSLGVSVMIFTLVLKASTLLIDIPPYFWAFFSGSLILILGIVTVFPSLWGKLKINSLINRSSNKAIAVGHQKKSFKGDVITGVALGPVFTSCSPTYFVLLATVLPASPFIGFIYLLAFTFGLMLSLFIVSFVGQKLVTKLGIASDPNGKFKKVIGVLFILVAIAILTGFDKKIETYLLQETSINFTTFEQGLLDRYSN